MISTKRERFLKFDDRARNVITMPELIDRNELLNKYKDCVIISTPEEAEKQCIKIVDLKEN